MNTTQTCQMTKWKPTNHSCLNPIHITYLLYHFLSVSPKFIFLTKIKIRNLVLFTLLNTMDDQWCNFGIYLRNKQVWTAVNVLWIYEWITMFPPFHIWSNQFDPTQRTKLHVQSLIWIILWILLVQILMKVWRYSNQDSQKAYYQRTN